MRSKRISLMQYVFLWIMDMDNLQIQPHKIPEGYTSCGQMLDVVFNKPMKDLYQGSWRNCFQIRTLSE